MGHEIVYCFRCSSRVLSADFEKGTAIQIGNRTCCAQCLPTVLSELPAAEREAALARLSQNKSSASQPALRKTPRGGVEAVSSGTPRGGFPNAGPVPEASNKMPLLVGAGAVVLAVLAWLVLGADKKAPPPEPTIGRTTNPPPPPPPETSSREKVAREAVLKARDAARSGIDIDLQVRLWEEAVSKSERTPSYDEATQERSAILVRRKEVYVQELNKLFDSVDGVVRQDEFKKAVEALTSARKRHDLPEWSQPIDRKIEEIRKTEVDGAAFKQSAEADNLVVMEAERFHAKVDKDHHTWTFVTAPPGFQGKGAMAALPNTNAGVKDFVTESPRMDYRILFVKTGRHYLWIRGMGETGTDDSAHVGLDGKDVKSSTAMSVSTGKWGWTNKVIPTATSYIDIAEPGIHVLNVWIREDGAILDRILITTNPKYAPKDAGPPESLR